MRIESPWLMILLVLLPLIGIYRKRRSAILGSSLFYSSLRFVEKNARDFKMYGSRAFVYLRYFAYFLMILALIRIQRGDSKGEIATQGIDIMIAMDASGSMRAEDFSPKNRLDVAKECASEFIQSRKSDRIGMVVFAGESFTICPLTIDHRFLLDRVEDLEIGVVPEDTTAIGGGLMNCLNRLKNAKRVGKSKNNVIILVTDGVNNAGSINPMTAAEIAKKMGVKIYTIGVGREGIVRMPVQTQLGPVYTRMKTEIDEKTLKDIADRTGGLYFRAQSENTLKQIYHKIDKLEKSRLKVDIYMNYHDWFPVFLTASLTIYGLERLMSYSFFRILP